MTSAIGDAIYPTVITKVAETIKALREALDWVDDAVGRVLAALPDWGPVLNDLKARLVVEAHKVLDMLANLTDVGGPEAIRQLGEDWVNHIGAVASTQAQALQRGQLPSNGMWEGRAATAYHVGVVPNQTSALSAVKDATDMVNEALNEVANAVGSFWATIGIALAALSAALVGAIAAKITILGIPPAVLAIVLACAAFAAAVYAAHVSLGNSLDMVDRLFAAATNLQPVQAGWPPLQSVDTLSDGSVRDGDPSEWRPTA